jgi:hypothetical protein
LLRIVMNLNSQADLGRRVVIASHRAGAKRRPRRHLEEI